MDVNDCAEDSRRVKEEGIAIICGYLTFKKVKNIKNIISIFAKILIKQLVHKPIPIP